MARDEVNRTGDQEEPGAAGRVIENIRHDATVDEVSESKYSQDPSGSGNLDEARAGEQEAEATESWPLFGTGVMTDAMWKGFLFGSVVGGLIGAVLVAPVAFFVLHDMSLWVRLLMFGACGAVAGGTAGCLYFGGRLPELEGEVMDADGRPSAGTTLRDPDTDARGN